MTMLFSFFISDSFPPNPAVTPASSMFPSVTLQPWLSVTCSTFPSAFAESLWELKSWPTEGARVFNMRLSVGVGRGFERETAQTAVDLALVEDISGLDLEAWKLLFELRLHVKFLSRNYSLASPQRRSKFCVVHVIFFSLVAVCVYAADRPSREKVGWWLIASLFLPPWGGCGYLPRSIVGKWTPCPARLDVNIRPAFLTAYCF